MDLLHYALGFLCGGITGLVLGLVGGGGSILAVPLMVYVVRVPSIHVTLGTSALAVGINAALGLLARRRSQTVNWRCGLLFAASGVVGAFLGSSLGQLVDGRHLIAVFGVLMIVIGLTMLRPRPITEQAAVEKSAIPVPTVLLGGGVTGLCSGFFGIGGGFLIVPALLRATHMPLPRAIGTSLVAVTAFGITTAANYAFADLIDWTLALVFISGGTIGSLIGVALCQRLSRKPGALRLTMASVILIAATYILFHGQPAVHVADRLRGQLSSRS